MRCVAERTPVRGTSHLCSLAASLVVVLALAGIGVPSFAQDGGTVLQVPEGVVNIQRPRIAAAPDGGYAVVYEGFVLHEPFDEWQIVVERFDAAGRPRGEAIFFEPEDACGGITWNEDYQTHAEPEFGPDGTLVVAMTHAGLADVLTDFVQSAETTLGMVTPDGRTLDLNDFAPCIQYKPRFSGVTSEYWPRLALSGTNIVLAQHGRFELQGENSPEVANAALHVVLGGLAGSFTEQSATTIEQAIVHDDPLSRLATHEAPDVAAAGTRIATAWQECPYEFVVENFDVVTQRHACSIQARFAMLDDGTLTPQGDAVTVRGGSDGTFSITPSVAISASGSGVVVWAETTTGVEGDVFAQRLGADGTLVGDAMQVNAGDGRVHTRPEVAMQADGAFAVVWTDTTAAGLRALVRRYDARGTPLEPPTLLDPDMPETGLPHVAASGDDYLFTWLGRTDASAAVTLHVTRGDRTTDTETAVPEHQPMSLYPHPASTTAHVKYTTPVAAPFVLTVFDALGREVIRVNRPAGAAGAHIVALDVSDLPSGLYLVHLDGPSGVAARRLVVAH